MSITKEQIKLIDETLAGPYGNFHDASYKDQIGPYDTLGDYFGASLARFTDDGEIFLDKEGIPKIKYQDEIYYNPVTVAQYALSLYGRHVKGEGGLLDSFRAAADKLLEIQSSDGGFSYPIELHHKDPPLAPGWRSAMAQGQAMSALARAFHVFKDRKYIAAGEKAYANLRNPVSKGGTRATLSDLDPSLSAYVFFPEYPYKPLDYTLNGYLFTLIGLYDWSLADAPSSKRTKKDFLKGIETLEKILPYYDIDGYSAYDLGHLVYDLPPYIANSYEGIHIYLLHGLNSIVSSPTLKYFETIWTRKIESLNLPLRITKIAIENKHARPRETVKLTLDTRGGTNAPVTYQFAVKFDGEWTFPQPYSSEREFYWSPQEPGEYALGFYVKNSDSDAPYDNFRWRTYVVEP